MKNWNLLNGVFLYQTGRPIRDLPFRDLLDLAYAYITRKAEKDEDFERTDRILAGKPLPGDLPQKKAEKLRPDNLDMAALDSLDALYKAPNIEPMTGEDDD